MDLLVNPQFRVRSSWGGIPWAPNNNTKIPPHFPAPVSVQYISAVREESVGGRLSSSQMQAQYKMSSGGFQGLPGEPLLNSFVTPGNASSKSLLEALVNLVSLQLGVCIK